MTKGQFKPEGLRKIKEIFASKRGPFSFVMATPDRGNLTTTLTPTVSGNVGQAYFRSLPRDLLFHLFGFLNMESIFRFARTCTFWNEWMKLHWYPAYFERLTQSRFEIFKKASEKSTVGKRFASNMRQMRLAVFPFL